MEKVHLSTCHFRLIKNRRRLESSFVFSRLLKIEKTSCVKASKIYFKRNNYHLSYVGLRLKKMESTNQGVPLGGNPSPFSFWGDVGAPYMATLSLPGLTIGLPVWLFSTSVVQNTMIPEQSSQQLDDSRVTPPTLHFVQFFLSSFLFTWWSW